MKNYLLILLTQNLPIILKKCWRRIPRSNAKKEADTVNILVDLDHFTYERHKSRRALVVLSPSSWLTAVRQFPNIKLYNHSGFVFSLVKSLNETGYVVDLVAPESTFKIEKKYDVFVGHGGKCKPFIDRLSHGTPIFQYIAGAHWKFFNKESEQRYDRFYNKYEANKPEFYQRSLEGLVEGVQYLNEKADVLFTINCPRFVAGYREYEDKFYFTGLGAYIDDLFKISQHEKNYDMGRKHFIYVGGTGGNLQKGLDLLIEAFSQLPEQKLYIYCKVEDDIMKHCKTELASSNVHYIYHWRFKPFHKRLQSLLKQTNFSVHAPINIGMGTAFMATMGVGLIPVGYVDLPEPVGESAVLTDSWQVDALVSCIQEASEKSPEWCERAARLTIEKYAEHCEPEKVESNFRKMFSEKVNRKS